MTHSTVLIWELAGKPPPPSPRLYAAGAAVCVMCAREVDASAPATKAIGSNFTDQYLYRAPHSDRICGACAWVCSGKPPATLRMWSLIAAPGEHFPASDPKAWLGPTPGLTLFNRSNPQPLARLLAAPPHGPWLASVAVSGQKHVAPYTRVTHGSQRAWTVRMENTDVTATPDEWTTVLAHAAALRAQGHGATAVRTLTPDIPRIRSQADLAAWRAHAEPLTPWRASPLLELALWCLTKPVIPLYAPT